MAAYRDEWDQRRGGNLLNSAGMGILRITLLFGSAAIAITLFLVPMAEEHTRVRVSQAGVPSGLDFMATGTVGQRQGGSYVIRRSVLQDSPHSVCIIRPNGERNGDC